MELEELQHRIKNAIILLKEGHTFKVGDLTFGCRDNNYFSVTGWTLKNELKSITKETALIELNEIKELFKRMTSASFGLADFINRRQIEYFLSFDYGMGGLDICSETNEQVKWIAELKE